MWVSSRDPDVRKTVGLEVELKLNLPSSCEETNQEAGLTNGGAGRELAGAKGRLAFVVCGRGETIGNVFALFSPRSSQCDAARIAQGGADRK